MSDKGPLLGKRTSGRPRVSPENYRSAGRAQPIGPLPTCVRAILRMRLGQEAFLADNACRLLRGSTPSICIHGFSALGAADEEAQPPLVTVNEYWPLAMATGLGREPGVTHQAFHAIIREVFVRELLRFAFVADSRGAVRYSRKTCSQLLMRLQSEGPAPLRCRHLGPHLVTHETLTMMYQEEWVS
jgi:hypothetical protein